MKTKELYTKDHELDLSQENEVLPPDYQEFLDKDIPADWWRPLDRDTAAQKKFLESLDDCPF